MKKNELEKNELEKNEKPKIKKINPENGNEKKIDGFKLSNYTYKTIKLYFLDNKSISAKLIKCEDFDIVVEIIKDEKPILLYIQKSSLKFLSFPPDDAPSEPVDYKHVSLKNLTGQEVTIFFKNESKSVTGILKTFYTYEIVLTVKINNTFVDLMIYKAAIKYTSIEVNKDIFN